MYTTNHEKEKMTLITEDFSRYNGPGTDLRKAQLRMLEILKVLDAICRKHEICYWLDYGTLLGAVRHGGFIPWDDDLDVSIWKKDYKRLYAILEKELPDYLVCQDWRNESKIFMKSLKIRDLNSYYIEPGHQKGDLKYQGIFIDVFQVEKIPGVSFRHWISNIYGKSFRQKRNMSSKSSSKLKALVVWPVAVFLEQISRFFAFITKSNRIANVYGGLNFKCTHPMNTIFPLQEIKFEDATFFAPADFDSYLKEIYNDYMVIPPVEKRAIHASQIQFIQ